jgi:hypothetical protein
MVAGEISAGTPAHFIRGEIRDASLTAFVNPDGARA